MFPNSTLFETLTFLEAACLIGWSLSLGSCTSVACLGLTHALLLVSLSLVTLYLPPLASDELQQFLFATCSD